jgi:hypothetical protein
MSLLCGLADFLLLSLDDYQTWTIIGLRIHKIIVLCYIGTHLAIMQRDLHFQLTSGLSH